MKRFVRALKRSEELSLVLLYGALLLVETGYVAWLERLPACPAKHEPSGFLVLPLWYLRPRAEVTLLLTLLGSFLAWSGIGLFHVFRNRSEEAKQETRKRLMTTSFYAAVAGANLLCVYFLR